jgi:hypothetical protein
MSGQQKPAPPGTKNILEKRSRILPEITAPGSTRQLIQR